MKNILLILVLSMSGITLTYSQIYGSFEWDLIGISYVKASDSNVLGFLGLYTEPRININEELSIGLRSDLSISSRSDDESVVNAQTSFAVTCDYYLRNQMNQRTLAGIGLGTFKSPSVRIDGVTVDEGGRSFGIFPRVGYEYGLLRLTAEYNLVFKESVTNYLALRLALNFGGKYKE